MNGADLTNVIPSFIKHSFNNGGQYCYRINRAYIHEDIYDKFMEQFIDGVKKIKVGIEEDCSMGPLCNSSILNKSILHIEDAVAKGANIQFGGEKIKIANSDSELFFQPTIIVNANHEMLVMKEETFGPVIGIQKIKSLKEGIRLANDSHYGLAAYVFTQDSGVGLQASRELEVGSVWVNNVKQAYYLCPFGGVKGSGQGREKSKYGLDEYLNIKTIYLSLPDISDY
ncbi:MAG: aldehyde dehydrogenase family protein [Flavobacteriaceae bacterium]|nr:aldehyde dehydrogenase family protein [Flavobacteriaceae bacterium]